MRGSQGTASFRNELNNFGGGNMMMWGAISYARTHQLVHIPDNLNGARYKDEVLTPHMLPAMNLRLKFIKMANLITLKSIAFR
jgi:hypothetical protein